MGNVTQNNQYKNLSDKKITTQQNEQDTSRRFRDNHLSFGNKDMFEEQTNPKNKTENRSNSNKRLHTDDSNPSLLSENVFKTQTNNDVGRLDTPRTFQDSIPE